MNPLATFILPLIPVKNGKQGIHCPEFSLYLVFPVFLLLAHIPASGQTNLLLNQGNKDYTKALTRDPNNTSGLFNLGNTLYQEKRYDSSRKIMEATANKVKDKGSKAAANYNIGNSYMSQQKWEDAVNAYKQTLRNNPQDADAKYNLSYAEEMMKKQQQQNKDNKNKDQDKQNKDQKDKDKKDQQNKDQQQQKKDDKQDKGDQDKDKKDDQKQDQQPQSQPGKLSEQQADQLLKALQQEEKKLQDKMKKEKGVPVKMDKDW
jgi:Ca-activated chloride channel family protein